MRLLLGIVIAVWALNVFAYDLVCKADFSKTIIWDRDGEVKKSSPLYRQSLKKLKIAFPDYEEGTFYKIETLDRSGHIGSLMVQRNEQLDNLLDPDKDLWLQFNKIGFTTAMQIDIYKDNTFQIRLHWDTWFYENTFGTCK